MTYQAWMHQQSWLIVDDEVVTVRATQAFDGTTYAIIENMAGEMFMVEFADISGARYFPDRESAMRFLDRSLATEKQDAAE